VSARCEVRLSDNLGAAGRVVSCVRIQCTMGRKNLLEGLIGLECVCAHLPGRFASIVDGQEPCDVVMRVSPAYGPWRCCTSCAVMLVCETSYTRYMMYEVITHRPAHSAHESETYLPMYYVRRRSSDLLMYHVLLRPLLKHNSPRIQSQNFPLFACLSHLRN
jgi:hypothetical protein